MGSAVTELRPQGSVPVSADPKHKLQLVAAALLFSTGGAVIKATSFNNWQVAGFRSLIAAATILAFLPEARRHWTWRGAAVGLAYALTLVLFVTANKLTTSANAIFLQSTAPLYLLALSPLLLKERIRLIDVLLMGVVAGGLVCFFIGHEPARATAPHPFQGNVVAAFSGLTYAFTIVGLRWMAAHSGGSPMSTVAMGNLIAFAICLPAIFPVHHAGPGDIAAIGYLGVIQISLAYVLLTAGVRHVPAVTAGTLLLTEPALNPVWTWLVHGERPGALAICGGLLILGASAATVLKPVQKTL